MDLACGHRGGMRDLRKKSANGRTPTTTSAADASTYQDRKEGTSVSINIQTLNDVLVAFVTTVGIAVAISIAFVAAGAIFERGQKRTPTVRPLPTNVSAQYPTQSDEAGELVLR